MDDLRPYVCTILDCSQAGKTYGSRSALRCHEVFDHRSKEPRTCVFCGEMLSFADLKDRSRHVPRHMEEIAFTVVTKQYEDWDFYSDASSVKYEGVHNARNTTASYDATPKPNACRE